MLSGNQVQGTTTGGDRNSCKNSDQTPNPVTYYQPITTTIATATQSLGNHPIAMLTSHGRSAPTVSGFHCPDLVESGYHYYVCDISSFDSQGSTTTSWTSNTSDSSDTTELDGPCTSGSVSVTLAIANPYGTTYKYASFSCPTGSP